MTVEFHYYHIFNDMFIIKNTPIRSPLLPDWNCYGIAVEDTQAWSRSSCGFQTSSCKHDSLCSCQLTYWSQLNHSWD